MEIPIKLVCFRFCDDYYLTAYYYNNLVYYEKLLHYKDNVYVVDVRMFDFQHSIIRVSDESIQITLNKEHYIKCLQNSNYYAPIKNLFVSNPYRLLITIT